MTKKPENEHGQLISGFQGHWKHPLNHFNLKFTVQKTRLIAVHIQTVR
jgi:hypothetical protein